MPRPGAAAVSETEELDRVVTAVEALAQRCDTIISVDSSTPSVMTESAQCGAGLLNDVRGFKRPGAMQAAAEAAGLVSPAEVLRADGEAVPARRRTFAMDAAHLAEAVAGGNEGASVHRLTIQRSLQRKLELTARRHVTALGPKLSAAVLVVDHVSGEVLAHVGSAGYFDKRRFGAIDMVKAVRSPGSALKPIIYGLAFDAGIAHPETLIEDRPVQFLSLIHI